MLLAIPLLLSPDYYYPDINLLLTVAEHLCHRRMLIQQNLVELKGANIVYWHVKLGWEWTLDNDLQLRHS